MNNLHFQMPGRLVMGEGCLEELPAVVARLGLRKPLMVTDPGLVKAGLAERAGEVLRRGGFAPAVFDRVEPDPRIELVYECAAAAKAAGADVLVGLGGGSSLDIAKTAAVIAGAGGRIEDMVGIDKVPERGLACVLLPTTAGTGSEVTPIAVLSDKKEKLKKGVVSEKLLADAALVDPLLALGLPPQVTAFTGMDALTHAIEAFTNRRAQAFVDTFAIEAVRIIGARPRGALGHGAGLALRRHVPGTGQHRRRACPGLSLGRQLRNSARGGQRPAPASRHGIQSDRRS
jgi:alcohol dehydrogenase